MRGVIPSAAIERVVPTIVGSSGPHFAPAGAGAGGAAATALPTSSLDWSALSLCEYDLSQLTPFGCPAGLGADWGMSWLARAGPPGSAGSDSTSVPAFLLVRMSRNALSDSLGLQGEPAAHGSGRQPGEGGAGAARLTMDAALLEGREQLRRVQKEFNKWLPAATVVDTRSVTQTGSGSTATPIAYYELDVELVQDRQVANAIPRVVRGVPVLVLPFGPASLSDAERIYKLKKGGTP